MCPGAKNKILQKKTKSKISPSEIWSSNMEMEKKSWRQFKLTDKIPSTAAERIMVKITYK